MRDYKKLNSWKNGIQIVKQVYFLAEKFGLQSQLSRAAVSIPSNIGEGRSRSSKIEFKRLLEIAMGSLFGVETPLIICKESHFLFLIRKRNTGNQIAC